MISLKHVSKSFGPLKAVDDASLEVKKGEIICLIGPSGSGKSTLLRCIAGLEDPEEGEVWIDGERLDLHSKDQKKLEKLRIKMGFVFQHFNLFPHMTVLENLTLAPIQVLGMDKAAAEQRAMELLARVDAIYRRVSLSGGGKTADEIHSGPFILNLSSRTLTKSGNLIDLTQVEFQIMEFFMQNPNKALERSEILSNIWGENYMGDVKIVDVNIRRLRMKIEDEPSEPRYLTTVWGYGYKWNP